MEPITDVRGISRIAYGFMGSMALFSALELDLFSHLANGSHTLDELAQASGIAGNRLQSLLASLVSAGLVAHDTGRYANAPASTQYLVRGAPGDFGEYLRVVNGRMMYPMLQGLHTALRGERQDQDSTYFGLYRSDADAWAFTAAQHKGSLGPASVLAKRVSLDGSRRLLDVGGGSGSFTIRLCQQYPELAATILDFPGTVPVAQQYAAEAGLTDRISHLAGNALAVDWPAEQDAVLMSYVWSAVGAADISEFARRAQAALTPGGQVLVHDFMVDDQYAGPPIAAWYLMAAVVENPHAVCLTPAVVRECLEQAGFVDIEINELLPGITSLATARKP